MLVGYHSLDMFFFSQKFQDVSINVIVILDGLGDCVELPLLGEGAGGRGGKD